MVKRSIGIILFPGQFVCGSEFECFSFEYQSCFIASKSVEYMGATHRFIDLDYHHAWVGGRFLCCYEKPKVICAQTQNSIFYLFRPYDYHVYCTSDSTCYLAIYNRQIKVIDYFSETDGTWNMRELLYMAVIHTYHWQIWKVDLVPYYFISLQTL